MAVRVLPAPQPIQALRDTLEIIRLATTVVKAYQAIRKIGLLLRDRKAKLEEEYKESERQSAKINESMRAMVQMMPHDWIDKAPDHLKKYISDILSGNVKPQGWKGINTQKYLEQHIGLNFLKSKRRTAYICLGQALLGLIAWTQRYARRVIVANGFRALVLALVLVTVSTLVSRLVGISPADAKALLARDFWDAASRLSHRPFTFDTDSISFMAMLLCILIGVYVCQKLVVKIADNYFFRRRRDVLRSSIFEFAATAMQAEGWIRVAEVEMARSDPFAEVNATSKNCHPT
jgi:hypothetical protein